MTREDIFAQAFETVSIGDITTGLTPVLFTSCCKKQAEEFVATNSGYALIHSTPAGKNLEVLDLFQHMSGKLAYLHWFYLSARFVIENTFKEETLFFANPQNPTSTAFGIEIPLLFNTKPNVVRIKNPLQDMVDLREEWRARNLMRPYVISLANLYNCGPGAGMSDDEAVLFKKFNENSDGIPSRADPLEYRTELSLKIMLSGYLSAFGGFAQGAQPGSLAL